MPMIVRRVASCSAQNNNNTNNANANNKRYTGERGIKHLYNRMEAHEKAVKIGFAVKSVPFIATALYLAFMGLKELNRGPDPTYGGMLITVSVLTLLLVYLLFQHALLRSTLVHSF